MREPSNCRWRTDRDHEDTCRWELSSWSSLGKRGAEHRRRMRFKALEDWSLLAIGTQLRVQSIYRGEALTGGGSAT